MRATEGNMEGFVDAASGKYQFGMLVCCDKRLWKVSITLFKPLS